MTVWAPAYLGVLVNHLFELCPIRARSRPELERCDWWRPCRLGVNPFGPDVEGLCGWCVRVWKARQPRDKAA
jgi:hypothetical protein